MFKLRREQMEAFRPLVRAQIPPRILADLQNQGVKAERDPATGDVVATGLRGFQTRIGFYPDGLPARLTQPSGATYQFQNDSQGRLAALTYPGGERVEMERDARGNITELRRPGLLSYGLEHDDSDRLLSVRYPDGSTTRLAYHPEGPLGSITDRMGATTRYDRDPGGRLRSIVDALGRETSYRTDTDGHLEAIVFPDGTSEAYAFDSEHGIAAITRRDGRVVLQELDAEKRLKSIAWGDGSKTEFSFDRNGNLNAAQNATSEVAITYDSAGNPLTEITQKGTVSYIYDPEGRLIRLINHFGASIEYAYDKDGRLELVRDWDGREVRFEHSLDGTISEIRYGNGLTEKQQYARLGRLHRSTVIDQRGRILASQEFKYDLSERLIESQEVWGDSPSQHGAYQFDYDAESRIIAEIDSLRRKIIASYEYDIKGNLIRDVNASFEVGFMDEPVRYGGAAIEYDGNGNMSRLPGPRGEINCNFSADGNLSDARLGATRVHFEYDALGRRILKTDGASRWNYGWAGHQLLWEEYIESPQSLPIRRDYLVAPDTVVPLGFRETGRTYWLKSDSRGAVTHAFDEEGRIAWLAHYDSFGSVQVKVEGVRQPFRLAGQYADPETGLYYNFARYYCPNLRSYLSRDPNRHKPEATNYSYARNDPWNRADPFGAIAPLLALGAVVLGAVIGGVVAAATGGDPVAGAVEGGIVAAAGVFAAVAAVGTVAAAVISVAAVGVSAFVGSVITQFRRGDSISLTCALKDALTAMVIDVALLGLGSIPGVRRAVGALGKRLANLGAKLLSWKPVRNITRATLGAAASQLKFSELSGSAKRLVRALDRKGSVSVGQGVHVTHLREASEFMGREVGVFQSKATGSLKVVLGGERKIVGEAGDDFLVHTHPVYSSEESHFTQDIRNSSSKVEAVVDWGGNVTHFNNTGVLDNPSVSPINSQGYIVGY